MGKLNAALVVAARPGSAPSLVAGARALADRVGVVFAGSQAEAAGADEGYRVPVGEDVPFMAGVPGIVQLVLEGRPELVLVESCADGRLAAGAVAAACGTSVLAEAAEIGLGPDGRVVAKRLVLGGAGVQTVAAGGVAVVTASAGLFEAEPAAPCPSVSDLPAPPPDGVKFLGRQAAPASTEDLSGEKIVVGIGRGVGSVAGVAAVRRLAGAIGAGVGATRPVAEEVDWYDGTRYIGLSGDVIRPDVYLACGVSGQVQHMVGVSGAGLIFAINNDDRATIFGDCDYGIVGDVNQVVPALAARFE